MADKPPRDEFDDLNQLEFPGAESEDPTEEERSFTFDEDYPERETPPPEKNSGPEPGSGDREEALLAAFRTLRGEGSAEPPAEEDTEAEEAPPAPEEAPPQDAASREDAVFEAFSRMAKKETPRQTPAPAASEKPAPAVKPEKTTPARSPEKKRSVPVPAEEPPREQSEPPAVRPARHPTRKQRQAMAERQVEQAPVTIGRSLRSNKMLVYDSELDEVDYTDEDDLPEMRDYMPIRFRRYGRLGLGGGIMYALFVISVSIVLACLAWMFASDVLALNKEEHSAIVTIEEYVPEDETQAYTLIDDKEVPITVDIDQVADELKSAGMIEYKWLFKLFSRFSHAETKIDPGTYDVSTELDYRALVTALQFGSGNQEITRITFPEGLSVEQIFTLLEDNHICHKADLYEAAANYEFDYDFLSDLPLGDKNRLEGYLFPDTYDFYQGEDASVAINRFLRNLNNRVTSDMRTQAANRGLSLRELLTFASLIEKEAGSDEERPLMASVIYNRLNAGMLLQLDCTLNYIKGTSTFDLTDEDIAIDNPYNTYMYQGLPPGPICCPGLASIEAVLEPENTDYWYWYSVDGVSSFFTNADDFNAFAAAHPY